MPKQRHESQHCNAELSAADTEKYIKKKLPRRAITDCKTIVYPNACVAPKQSVAPEGKIKAPIRVRVLALSAYEACLQEFIDDRADKDSTNPAETKQADLALPLILDFASDSNPGGGWRSNQQGTQEETLCRGSTLGLRLEEQFQTGEYLSQSAYSAIYLDNIQVFHLGGGSCSSSAAGFLVNPIKIAVIAATLRDCDGNQDFLEQKIAGILKIAAEHGHRKLVLGAWGCGAFGNDPEMVAKAFRKEILRYVDANAFEEIIFAIPGDKKSNFQVFYRVLGS
eukprot:gb/GFBE01013562.1/.p1 GENE.gb/GFBE01013562.1/~~gb/GFBE01013562.1/.p1  ORF type:complete len:281 (+),score=42.99 gb/GFBE01013562.1/:1-843(+)